MQTRMEIINFLVEKFGYKNYLEIGLRNPNDCFNHIGVDVKCSVDPGLETEYNQATYKYTSDDFFKYLESGSIDLPVDHKWDIIFIDGLHMSYQVEKDIQNSLIHLSEKGTIVLHDCNPPTEHHARCTYYDFETPAGTYWNGTVWKAIYKLRCTKPDVDVCVVDTDWGCGIVRFGSQELCEFDNPFYEYEIFSENRKRSLNLIGTSELDEWLDKPFYSAKYRW